MNRKQMILWALLPLLALPACSADESAGGLLADEGRGGGGIGDPDDEISGIEGGNAVPTDDSLTAGGGDGPTIETRLDGLVVADGKGGLWRRAPGSAGAPRPVELPGLRLDVDRLTPVFGGDLMMFATDQGLRVLHIHGQVTGDWAWSSCSDGLLQVVHLPTRGIFAVLDDRSGCEGGAALRQLSMGLTSEESATPADLRILGEAVDGPRELLYVRPKEVGRIDTFDGERKPGYVAVRGEVIRAAARTFAGDVLFVVATATQARIVRLDRAGAVTSVEHRIAPPGRQGRLDLIPLAGGALALADDDGVRFFGEPGELAVFKDGGPGALVASRALPDGKRLLATWKGISAVMSSDPFDGLSFRHEPGHVPVVNPEGTAIAYSRPVEDGVDGCSAGVDVLELERPEQPISVSDTPCERPLAWLQATARE